MISMHLPKRRLPDFARRDAPALITSLMPRENYAFLIIRSCQSATPMRSGGHSISSFLATDTDARLPRCRCRWPMRPAELLLARLTPFARTLPSNTLRALRLLPARHVRLLHAVRRQRAARCVGLAGCDKPLRNSPARAIRRLYFSSENQATRHFNSYRRMMSFDSSGFKRAAMRSRYKPNTYHHYREYTVENTTHDAAIARMIIRLAPA